MKATTNPAAVRFAVRFMGFLISLLPLDLAASEVKLAWNPNPETDIAGYRVEYGTIDFSKSHDTGNVTTTVVSNLVPGLTYQFRLVAINTSGLESDPCEPITHTILVPLPIVKLVVQKSNDLKAWAEIQTIEVPQQEAEFFRIRIEIP